MMTRLATTLRAARPTLLADAAGVIAIGLMTLTLLHLPGLI